MNIAAVRLFLEVAEAGSLSKVAARRQTVQSHVSRQIADFEAGFGGPLFRRTGRGVVLTELGERAAGRLQAWLEATDRLSHELRSDASRLVGEVRLGIIPSAAHPLITTVFHQLQTEQPGVRLSLIEAQGAELDALLDTNAVDLAILFRHRPPSGREEKPLCVAHTYLVSAPGDALTQEPTVAFSKLEGLRLVLQRRPSLWRTALDEAARAIGFKLDTVVDADSLIVQKELVASTPGLYTILGPYSMAAELAAGRLCASRLVRPDLQRHVTLALPRQGKRSPAARFVADLVADTVKAWGRQLTSDMPSGIST